MNLVIADIERQQLTRPKPLHLSRHVAPGRRTVPRKWARRRILFKINNMQRFEIIRP
jgi:hypothetical protein